MRGNLQFALPFMCGGNFTWDGWYNGEEEEDVTFLDLASLEDEVGDWGAGSDEEEFIPHPATLLFLALLL